MNICIEIEGYVSPFADQLPKVQTQDLIYIESFEKDAYGHWLFGKDSTSLIDRVNGRALTLQGGATVTPIYMDTHVRLGAAKGQSLESGLLDTNNGYTISGVLHPEDPTLMILLGTLAGSNDLTGAGLFTSSNKAYVTARPRVSSLDAGLTIGMNKPLFVSMSVNNSSGVTNIVAMQNGILYEKSATGAQVPSGTKLAFGNSRYTTSSAYNTLKNKFYEGIIHDRSLSISEMKAVANRAKKRQHHRGNLF